MEEGSFKKEEGEELQEMGRIESEEKKSKLFTLQCKNVHSELYGRVVKLVALTKENVAKVEAMIRTDSAYRKAFDENACPIRKRVGGFDLDNITLTRCFSYEYPENTNQTQFELKYGGSTAYWMRQIKEKCEDNPERRLSSIRYLIGGVVWAIDRENSTHLNAGVNGRRTLVRRIVNECETFENLKERLQRDDMGENGLLQQLARSINNERANLSFASKFCHYASYYFLEGNERDRYSIFDNVVGKVLPCYLEQLNEGRRFDRYNEAVRLRNNFVNNGGPNNPVDYKLYHEGIGALLSKDEKQGISRNGFDHLVWYFHKGRDL